MRAPTFGTWCPEHVCAKGLWGSAAVGGAVTRQVPFRRLPLKDTDQGQQLPLCWKVTPCSSGQRPDAGSRQGCVSSPASGAQRPCRSSSSLTLSWRIISTWDTSGQVSVLHMGRVFRINEVQNFRVPMRNGISDKLLLLISTCFNRWIRLVSDQRAGHWSPVCCRCLVAKSCLTLGNTMDYGTPSFPVLHSLVEFA